MPFNIWCDGCARHIARGVRFNAEKKEIGKYYSTAILSFRMKCPSCSNWIEIHTDPRNSEYVVVSGGKRKMEGVQPEAIGLAPIKSQEEAEKLLYNPFFRLEHEFEDMTKAKRVIPQLGKIIQTNERVWKEDFESSRAARQKLRVERAELVAEKQKAIGVKERLAIHDLPLLPENPDDRIEAKKKSFHKVTDTDKRVSTLKESSIFDKKIIGKRKQTHAQLLLSNVKKNVNAGKSGIIDQLKFNRTDAF